jgi:CRP-like cAMP-binding protein
MSGKQTGESREEMVETLRGVDALRDFKEEFLEQLAEYMRCEEFPPNTVIFREGDPPSLVYLIDRGTVALEISVPGGGSKRIHTVTAGELLGWTPLLDQAKMTATARTLSPTRACGIDARQVLALCEKNPRLGFELMRRTALALMKRLTATRLQLLDVYRHELPSAEHDKES